MKKIAGTKTAKKMMNIFPMLNEVEKFVGELRDLRERVTHYEEALMKIEKFGHGYGHGHGYTCADIAKEALNHTL